MTYDETLKLIDQAQSQINDTPCRFHDEFNEPICLEPRPGEGVHWSGMNPARMCGECAAYWHLGEAVNALHRERRRSEILAASK